MNLPELNPTFDVTIEDAIVKNNGQTLLVTTRNNTQWRTLEGKRRHSFHIQGVTEKMFVYKNVIQHINHEMIKYRNGNSGSSVICQSVLFVQPIRRLI